MKSSIIFAFTKYYKVDKVKEDTMCGGMWHIWRRAEGHTEFWWENLKERDNVENLGVDMRIILKCILKKLDGKAWTGFNST
jgi:hypothetical protein